MEHTEEVTSLVRDAVDRRVRLYIDCLHKRGQPKHKRELPRANPLCVKGRRVSLVANFVKRHFNLRCIVKHQYGELRVFPERYVVCVSRLEDASANPTPAVTVSQSTESQYFSRPAAETRDELNSSTITKRSSLQKIARHANARPRPETQPLPCGSVLGKKLHSEQNGAPGEQVPEPQESRFRSPRRAGSGVPGEQVPEPQESRFRSPRRAGSGAPGEQVPEPQESRFRSPRRAGSGVPGEQVPEPQESRFRSPRRAGSGAPGEQVPEPQESRFRSPRRAGSGVPGEQVPEPQESRFRSPRRAGSGAPGEQVPEPQESRFRSPRRAGSGAPATDRPAQAYHRRSAAPRPSLNIH
ncbi:protein SLX4IP isoform X2 [Oncorhynchus masou masou]